MSMELFFENFAYDFIFSENKKYPYFLRGYQKKILILPINRIIGLDPS
jgi:hypothetical protein